MQAKKIFTKKEILKEVANDLREFNFNTFNIRKDKAKLITHLKMVNSKLDKMIRKILNENQEDDET